MLKKFKSMILTAIVLALLAGCNPGGLESVDLDSTIKAGSFEEFMVEADIKKIDGGYLWEGDILLNEEVVQNMYSNYQNKGNIALDFDNLVDRYVWTDEEKNSLTYAFKGSLATASVTEADDVEDAFREALADWVSAGDLTVTEVTYSASNPPDITIVARNKPEISAYALATFPHMPHSYEPDTNSVLLINLASVDELYKTVEELTGLFTHEIGHSFGLAHEHNRADAPNVSLIYGEPYGSYDSDSVMDYANRPYTDGISYGDIATIQHLYGYAEIRLDFNGDLEDNGNYGLSGVNSGGVFVTDSAADRAFDLSGSNYGQITHDFANLGERDFTISVWVKTTSTRAYNTIIDKRDSGTNRGYALRLYNGRPQLFIRDSNGNNYNYYYTDGQKVNDGKWHNIFFSAARHPDRQYKTMDFYIDGLYEQLFDSNRMNSVPGNIDSSAPLRIGKHVSSSSYNFDGIIDNLLIQKKYHTYPKWNDPYVLYNIKNGETKSGEWTDESLDANHKSGCYAYYYPFKLYSTKTVTITLNSTEVPDTFLYLLNGPTIDSPILEDNDDIIPGVDFNSEIEITLPAGVYMIEATTFSSNKKGKFTVTLDYPC